MFPTLHGTWLLSLLAEHRCSRYTYLLPALRAHLWREELRANERVQHVDDLGDADARSLADLRFKGHPEVFQHLLPQRLPSCSTMTELKCVERVRRICRAACRAALKQPLSCLACRRRALQLAESVQGKQREWSLLRTHYRLPSLMRRCT